MFHGGRPGGSARLSPLRNCLDLGPPGLVYWPMNATDAVDVAIGSHPLIGRTVVTTRAASQADPPLLPRCGDSTVWSAIGAISRYYQGGRA